jgi:hypothetical protein
MIRFVFRFAGLVALALGFIFLVHDGTKSIADQTLYLSSVSSTWENVHQSSLAALQPVVERYAGTWGWQGVVKPYFLDQPVSLVLAIIGAILILVGRKKKPLIGYARD